MLRSWRPLVIVQLSLVVTAAGGCRSTSTNITGPGAVERCSATVAVSRSQFSPDGGEGTLTVTTARDCPWEVRTDAAWLTLGSPTAAQGTGTVPFAVASTSDPVSRSAALNILDQQVTIAQTAAPCRYELSAVQLTIPAAGGNGEVGVTASSALCEWTAQANAEWVSLPAGRSYKGDAQVPVQAPAWAGPPRHAEIAVADQRVTLTQSDGCAYTVTPAVASIAAAGGPGSVSVQTSPGCAWTAVSRAAWVKVSSGAGGSGAGATQFTVDPNIGPARSATIMVANRLFTINQASGCDYRLDPAAWTFGPGGGPGAVNVNVAAGCSWTAQSDSSWLAIGAGASGSGPGAVQLTVAPNEGPARTGGINVNAQRFTASQASGCTYTLSITTWTFGWPGEVGWIYVTTAPGCVWGAVSHDDWIRFTSETTVTGPGFIYFAVDTNHFGLRSGSLSVAGHGFTAIQNPAPGFD